MTERPDQVSAMMAAQMQHSRVEVLSERTDDSTTYANPDGSLTTETYAGQVRVKQDDGTWKNIDTDLSDTGPSLQPKVTPADIKVSDGGDTSLVSVTAGKKTFGLGWEDKLPTPTIRGDVASYDLGDGATLTVQALPQGFTQNVVLDAAPTAPVSYRIPVNLTGLSMSKDPTGHLLMKDSAGKLVAVAPAPRMWDSSLGADSGEPLHQAEVATSIEKDADGTTTLVLTPDPGWLADPALTYPVTVDPTSTLAQTTDTWLETDYAGSQRGSDELRTGTYDSGTTKARSYLKFDVSKVTGKHVISANFQLYSWWSFSCSITGSGVTVRQITTSWDPVAVTWDARPSSTATNQVTSKEAHGYSTSCPDAWQTWSIGGIVQAWANGAANYGLMLYGTDETDNNTWRKYRSANYSDTTKAPKLTVNYNTKPGAAALLAPASGTATADTTPTLQAKATDADGNAVKLTFEVWNSTGTTKVASGTTATVSSGATASWTAPALAQATYKWRAQASDGTDTGAWSAWNTLTVDITAPAAPTVTSSSHPSSSSWYSAKDFTAALSATDASGIAGYAVKIDQSAGTDPGTTVTQTGTALSRTGLADGTWYVHAAAKNGAGLWSSAKHFAFNVDALTPGVPTSLASSTHPLPTSAYNSKTASFTWKAPADLSGVAGYAVKADQSATTLPTITDTYTTDTSYSTTVARDGTWYLHVRAKDKAGNWSTSAAHFKFTIDTTLPPTSTITSTSHPDQNSAYSSGAFHATWTPPTGAAAGYSLTVDDQPNTVPDTTVDTTDSSYSATKGDGTWYLHLRAVDAAGNWGATAHYRFTVDTTAPAAPGIDSDDYPSDAWAGAIGTPGVFTLTPPDSDAAQIRYSVDGAAATTVDTDGTSVEIQYTPTADGGHTLTAWTVDLAGNLSASQVLTFHVGIGRITSPGTGDRPARNVELQASGPADVSAVTFAYRRGETDTWTPVPAGDVTAASDGSSVTWPLAMSNGTSLTLIWHVTDTLTEDGSIQIIALFDGHNSPPASEPIDVTVDRNAGDAPSAQVGPGEVNLLTGDYTQSVTDASVFGLSVTRTASSRRPAQGSAQDGQSAIFGAQWTAGTVAEIADSTWSYLEKTSSTSVSLVDLNGDSIGFTATSTGGWKPELGAESLTLTSADSDGKATNDVAAVHTFTVTDTDGATATFTQTASATTTWQVTTTSTSTANSTTTVVPEHVTVAGRTLARPHYVVAPTSAVTTGECTTAPSTKGCRVLEYVYADATTATAGILGDYVGQVTQVRLWATTPGDSSSTATPVADYAYDGQGRLRETWDPRISPAVKTAYAYDSVGRVITFIPPGQLPWTFTYGKAGSAATAGDGMLLSASRPTLRSGSENETDGGTAKTSVVYDVPLTGAGAPEAMGAGDVAAWGQAAAPTDATAVFPPDVADHVPASHGGTDLRAADYNRATITYIDGSGREVNTANPGHRITSTEYNSLGNVSRQLTAGNRELAVGGSSHADELDALGIAQDSSAQRAQLLSITTLYNGPFKTEELGPLHLITLDGTLNAASGGTDVPAGSQVAARQHTVFHYDEGRPTDGSAKVQYQVTSTVVGAAVDGYPSDADPRTTRTTYDWTLGLPTHTIGDPDGLAITTTTAYDGQGRVTRGSRPKSDGKDAGTTVTTYWSANGTGPCADRPEWADLICSTGPAAAITGGPGPSELPGKTVEYDRWGNPSTTTETANGVTRTSTTTYDDAGRVHKVSVSGGSGTAVPDTTTTYEPATGQVATVNNGTTTVTQTYDALGRRIAYNDGTGNTTQTRYDSLDRPVQITDSAPSTTTYTYDSTQNPTGAATSISDSVAGVVNGEYDTDNRLRVEHLPGGVDLTIDVDPSGAEASRTYRLRADGTLLLNDTVDSNIHGQVVTRTDSGGAQQLNTYDAVGRLTHVDDTQVGTVTHRSYTFDGNANRTALATVIDNPDGSAGTPTTVNYTYDTGDRLVAPGTGYDAFGRTAQTPQAAYDYYVNDMIRRQTANDRRQTWTLGPGSRLAAWTVESRGADGSWIPSSEGTNHYGTEEDSPDWILENGAARTISRNVRDLTGDLMATTSDTGDTVLQLTNVHGDVAVQYPLDPAKAPIVQSFDENGNPLGGTLPNRYGWLGAKQRSSETLTGDVLMGARLYQPGTARFLSVDPEFDGTAASYGYCNADSVNCTDLSGRYGANPWGCGAFVPYVHRSHTNPHVVNVHADLKCKAKVPLYSIRVRLYRSRWWGWEHIGSTGYVSGTYKYKARAVANWAPHGTCYYYLAMADFMIAGGNLKIQNSVHNWDLNYVEGRPEMCVR
ncbi:DNRLRE domain-containing protein [Planotetraspora mira]|uniref:DNRLRE domain-containing protein n=1 Tax=Planotetraspora mira TaxID=58121 RepID=UPI0036722766